MEMNESYDSVFESAQYQKTRGLLDVINQEIFERAEAAELAENAPVQGKKVSEAAIASAIRHRAEKMAVPESWIKSAIKRIQLGESDRGELSAELTLRYDLTEAEASWMLLEGEEQKAENILATKDMVGKITNWIEDTAAMKADQLLELLDSIRAEQGSDVAQQFNQTVQPALEGVYALVTAREGLSNALAIVSGEQAETMGAAPDMGAEMGGMGAEMGAEIGGMPAAGGEAELGAEMGAPSSEAGRMKRESVEYSRRLGMLLSSKKK
jgi:predicted XRE-type DNA-binding protein